MGAGMDMDAAIESLRSEPAAYVLLGAGGDFLYKGACHSLIESLKAHRSGCVKHTKGKRPLSLVYWEYCADYSGALKREAFLKSGQGRKWLNEQIARVAKWQTHQT